MYDLIVKSDPGPYASYRIPRGAKYRSLHHEGALHQEWLEDVRNVLNGSKSDGQRVSSVDARSKG